MRFFTTVLVALLQFSVLGLSTRAADEPLPESWKKTMTGDPATNAFLKKYSEKSPVPAVQYYRDMYLIALLSGCGTLDIRLKTFFEYEKTIGFDDLSPEDIKDAKLDVGTFFRGIDIQAAAHLCAGGDYMFGKNGILIANVMRPNGQTLNVHYDPANPDVNLEIDKIEGAFNSNRK
jgi:hypothetical protein